MTTPFTYLIGWSQHNKYYYGVRYAQGCHPSDLWKTYFTSSKYVTDFRESHGEPDLKEIRKIFNTDIAAIRWEDSVIKRAKLYKHHNFLNKAYSGAIHYDVDVRQKLSEHAKKPRSDNFKKARSVAMKKMWLEGIFDNRPVRSQQYKENMSNILKKKYSQEEHHCAGRELSASHKANISEGVRESEKYKKAKDQGMFGHSGKKNGMYGKLHSDDTKNLIKEKALNRAKHECVGCGKYATKQVLARYHKKCVEGGIDG